MSKRKKNTSEKLTEEQKKSGSMQGAKESTEELKTSKEKDTLGQGDREVILFLGH
jgi:hypothetical protein